LRYLHANADDPNRTGREARLRVRPGFCPQLEPIEAATALGMPEQVDGLRLVQELVPYAPSESTPNTYSGSFGLHAFPLHTDLAHWASPPRYLMLRCEVGDPAVRTWIIDSGSLCATLRGSALGRCLARPRRPINGGFQLLPILQEVAGSTQALIRWDSIYLTPANAYAQTVFGEIESCLSRVRPTTTILLSRGDTLVLDNWRVLHGRSAVQNARSPRRIHRVYLSALA